MKYLKILIIIPVLLLNFIDAFSTNEFIPNKGRLLYSDGRSAEDIKYTYETPHYMAYLTNNSIDPVLLFLKSDTFNPSPTADYRESRENEIEAYRLSIKFANSNISTIVPKEKNENYYNYYFSHIKLLEVNSYNALYYNDLYEGIDLEVYTDIENNLEYDFIISPNSDLNQIKLKIEEKYSILENGDLQIETPLGYILQDKPIAFQDDLPVDCSFKIVGDYITFDVGEYDRNKPLRIDPVTRTWGTYYGGILDDKIYDLKIKDDKMYFGGLTYSPSKIAFNGHQTIHGGNYDAFLVKSDTTGKRIWATYYGGDQYEITFGLDVDSEDNVYIVGEASSLTGIATVNAHQETFGGDWADGFIAKFDDNGERKWATYFGGDKDDKLNDISIDDFDNIYVVGYSYSESNISQNGHKDTLDGQSDAILAKFNPLGELSWATYYGGRDKDIFTSIEIYGSLIYLGGTTNSRNNIFFNGFDDTRDGDFDGFLTKFQTGGTLDWCTYYGGTEEDYINDIAILDSNIYMVGTTYSTSNIAYPNTTKQNYGEFDGFVGYYTPDGTLKAADFVGGSDSDYFYTIAKNEDFLYIGGTTKSNDIETNLQSYQLERYAQYDGLYAKYDKTLKWITSSYFGGLFTEDINVFYAENDYFYFAGSTTSEEFISENGYQMNIGGKIDGHIQKFKEVVKPEVELFVDTLYCAESEFKLHYIFKGELPSNANISLELSDKSGSFDNAVVIADALLQIDDSLDCTLGLEDFSEEYRLRAYVDSLDEYFYFNEYIIIINKAEIISLPDSTCLNSRIDFITYDNPDCTYEWYINNGITDILLSTKSQFSKALPYYGNYKILLKQNYKDICISEVSKNIHFKAKTPIYISGQEDVCYNKPYTYHMNNLSSDSLTSIIWEIGDNEIISENGLDSITVIWRENKNNKLNVTITNEFGCNTSYFVTVTPYQFTLEIYGLEKSCAECVETYYVDNEEGTFDWKVEGGEITEGNGENKIKVKWKKSDFNSIELLYTSEEGCQALKKNQIIVSDKREVNIFGKNMVCLKPIYKYLASSDETVINTWYLDTSYAFIVKDSYDFIEIIWKKEGTTHIKLVQEIIGQFKDSTEFEVEILDLSNEELEIQYENSPICKFDKRSISIINPKYENYEFNISNAQTDSTFENGVYLYFDNIGEVIAEITGKNHLETGCDYTYLKEFLVNDLPITPIIEKVGKKIISSIDENYMWYLNGIEISDLNSKEIYPTKKGLYSVRTYNKFGCYSELSNEIYYEPNSVFDDDKMIIIYPQPANEKIIISNLPANKNYNIRLFNLNGKVVLTSNSIMKSNINLDVNSLTTGFYILELESDGKSIYKKIFILK